MQCFYLQQFCLPEYFMAVSTQRATPWSCTCWGLRGLPRSSSHSTPWWPSASCWAPCSSGLLYQTIRHLWIFSNENFRSLSTYVHFLWEPKSIAFRGIQPPIRTWCIFEIDYNLPLLICQCYAMLFAINTKDYTCFQIHIVALRMMRTTVKFVNHLLKILQTLETHPMMPLITMVMKLGLGLEMYMRKNILICRGLSVSSFWYTHSVLLFTSV